MRIIKFLSRLALDKRGAQSIELAMICAMIVIGIVAAVKGVADESSGLWAVVSSRSAGAMTP